MAFEGNYGNAGTYYRCKIITQHPLVIKYEDGIIEEAHINQLRAIDSTHQRGGTTLPGKNLLLVTGILFIIVSGLALMGLLMTSLFADLLLLSLCIWGLYIGVKGITD
jgi:hypothetical protein